MRGERESLFADLRRIGFTVGIDPWWKRAVDYTFWAVWR